MSIRTVLITIGEKKRVDISLFKGQVYLHFHDMIRNKNVTFSRDEFDTLVRKLPKISDKVKRIGQSAKEKKQKATKKTKPKDSGSDTEILSSSDSS